LWPALAYVPLLAGSIENWRLGCDEVDDLLASLYYTKSPDSPKFNKLFATLYNLMFSKLTNLVPGESPLHRQVPHQRGNHLLPQVVDLLSLLSRSVPV
jgi:hypothetical protein